MVKTLKFKHGKTKHITAVYRLKIARKSSYLDLTASFHQERRFGPEKLVKSCHFY
jgi:hypothetical protein